MSKAGKRMVAGAKEAWASIPEDIDSIATDIVRMQFADDVDGEWEQYKARPPQRKDERR